MFLPVQCLHGRGSQGHKVIIANVDSADSVETAWPCNSVQRAQFLAGIGMASRQPSPQWLGLCDPSPNGVISAPFAIVQMTPKIFGVQKNNMPVAFEGLPASIGGSPTVGFPFVQLDVQSSGELVHGRKGLTGRLRA